MENEIYKRIVIRRSSPGGWGRNIVIGHAVTKEQNGHVVWRLLGDGADGCRYELVSWHQYSREDALEVAVLQNLALRFPEWAGKLQTVAVALAQS